MIKHIADYVGEREGKHFKTTLFEGDHLMIGLNCFEPGQVQHVHAHDDQDKFYYVVSGRGLFTVGEEEIEASAEHVIFAPAGIPHGVVNPGPERLVVLMGISG